MRSAVLILLLSVSLVSCRSTGVRTSTTSADWPQWRGPHHNGSADASNLPVIFSPTENVKWVTSLPGPAASTPVIVGERVFLTSSDLQGTQVLALCVSRRTGQELWRRELGKGHDFANEGKDPENFMAAPSPVTDGQAVYFLTGQGDLVAFDMRGREQWRRNVQVEYGGFNYMWGYGSSPLLHHNRLFVQVLHRDTKYAENEFRLEPESYVLALDSGTGEVLYRHVRPTDAVKETKESYATPIPHEVDGRTEIVILGADYITGHDPATGDELWRYGSWNPKKVASWRMVTSPVVGAGLLYASCPKNGPIHAVAVNGSETKLAWEMPRGKTTDVPTPLFYRDRLFVLNGKKKTLTCLDPNTGKEIWTSSERLPIQRYSRCSLTAGDGKIYCIGVDGETLVFDAGDEYKLLHQVNMGGAPVRASIAIAHGSLFIRTADKLYCIGG